MSGFLSGAAADCGPSNVLKNVGGRMDRDVSMQQDRFVPAGSTAGSSRRVMATGPRSAGPEQQRLGSSRTSGPSQAPFDMSSLRNHLIPTQPTLVNPPAAAYSNAQWAGSFRPDQQQPQAGPSTWERNASPAAAQSAWAASFNPRSSEVQARSTPPLQAREQYASQTPEYRQRYTPNYPPSFPSFQAQYSMPSYVPSATHHHQLHTEMIQHAPQDQQMGHHAWPTTADFDMQAESSTARQETAPAKEFSEWDEPLPEVNWQDDIPADLNDILRLQPTIPEVLPLRPGATQETIPRNGQLNYNDQSALLMSDTSSTAYRRKSVHFRETSGVPSSLEEALAQSSTAIPGMTSSWEDPLVTDLSDFDEDAFMAFNGERGVAYDQRIGVGDMEGWGEMQKDWEELQNTMPKTKDEMRGADGRYLFQSRNPYAEEMASLGHRERQEGRESPTARGVLELEAAVQADPTDHSAWYALGLKQQENERESAAILALGKVVQLDPDYRPAYLALAVSYTNEGELQMANRMISKWIDLAPMASQLSAGVVRDEDESWREGQKVLVERLIGLARMSPEELDPDVQVALGVLFNSGEQFDKAEDCLLAALSVRPNDWLLYNRIGATLANSGRSNEALEYYHKALSLHPNFIRALFNMGISYINLSQYSLAAQRILDALRLQQADATEGYASGTVGKAAKGVTSETLWTTLRSACLHMGRSDLVSLATRRDLSGFPGDLTPGGH